MDKHRKAAALSYNQYMDNAPKLVAKGQGLVAEKIIQLAKKHKIPIVEDPLLVDSLIKIDLYEEIPPHLYEAVAKIVAYIIKHEKGKD
ncbi:MAG: flagellar biosynthesis protein FlhB [Gammaproteobacteria bacterium]|nr:MAG: flagellar biosynthesis protein FlhB [Gammaproteobacteria bacterium]RTZ70791.1 MAG: flagellar biosynthesis protein FlhB [Aquificaceae bacterium]